MSVDLVGTQPVDLDVERKAVEELVIPVRGMTCQSCVRHVGGALRAVPGVTSAVVDLRAGRATVRFDPGLASVESLQGAVEAVGYVAGDPVPASGGNASQERVAAAFRTPGYVSARGAVAGMLASVLLVGFYFVVMTVAQGADAAISLMQEDWYLFAPLVIGLGVQVALFWRAREIHVGEGRRPTGAVTGASGGISGLSMLACCAHHLTDLLPLVGLAGLAAFLGEYRQPLMGVGIASNLAGIAVMLRVIRRRRELA